MSIVEFISQMMRNPMLLVSSVLILGVILVNGWTDAPNAIATCVSTRAISVKKAIVIWEDILRLVQIIDDITDAIDEVILDIYMYHIDVISKNTIAFSKKVNCCVKALDEAAAELKNFKKREALHRLLVKLNDIEGEADQIFTEGMYELFASEVNMKNLIGQKAVFEGLESCCDLCEHAADLIEQIVIKNT